MKIPKWHEVEPKHITVTWDMGREGEKPCIAVFIEKDGKVYCSKIYNKNDGAINLGELVCQLTEKLEKAKEREDMKIMARQEKNG